MSVLQYISDEIKENKNDWTRALEFFIICLDTKDPLKELERSFSQKYIIECSSSLYSSIILRKTVLANIAAEKNSLVGLSFLRSRISTIKFPIYFPMNTEIFQIYDGSNREVIIRSPLYWVCYHKNLKMLQFLIESRVDLFHKSNSTTVNNPLFIAIEKGFYEGVKLLLTNNFRYTKISNGSLANFYEMLEDATVIAFDMEIKTPYQIVTIQIIDFLLSYQQNRYEYFLGDVHQGFLRYIKKRSFVYVRHSFLQSYSNIPRLYSVERTEKGDIVWTNSLSKRKTRYYLQKFNKISLLYEILCNEDLARTISQYM